MKKRADFLNAANRAYEAYERAMFRTAKRRFEIEEPTVDAITAFQTANPVSTFFTDGMLDTCCDILGDFLRDGREIYADAKASTESVEGGLADENGHWTSWMDSPTNKELPTRIRLGEVVMYANWLISPRFEGENSEKTIAEVELRTGEPVGVRTTRDAIISHINSQIGLPLGRLCSSLREYPDKLLWLGNAVRVFFNAYEMPGDPDEGIPSSTWIEVKISRKRCHKDPYLFGGQAMDLLE